MKTYLPAVFLFGLCLNVFSHGRSESMLKELNAPVPSWMSLAEPIRVEPTGDRLKADPKMFRPRSGGATNSRNRVRIPERNIEFQVDYSITYSGNSAVGHGVSLSPDGKKLIVNSGTKPHLCEIAKNGEHLEVPIRIPHVTYDEGLKGFVTKWSWVSDDILLGHGEITDERGHELVENRLYLFHLEEQALVRLDLSRLDLPKDTAGLEVAGIGNDLRHLLIRLGDREFVVKADLESPPIIIGKPAVRKEINERTSDSPGTSPATGARRKQDTSDQASPPKPSIPWGLFIVLAVVLITLLWIFLKQKNRIA